MKHAGPEALANLEPLLQELRKREPLREKKTGIFYLKSRAFLHFHEDPAGLFADVRVGVDFDRLAVNTKKEQKRLLSVVDKALG